jgi:hypothetical protein
MAMHAEKRIYRLADLKIIGKRKRSYGISAALFYIDCVMINRYNN